MKTKIKKAVCWIFVLIFITGIIVLINDPPIEKSEKKDDGFNRYNWFVKKHLSERFNLWDVVIQKEMLISDHYYRYICGFAGDPSFLISVKIQFDNLDEYREICQRVQNIYPANRIDNNLSICGKASDDYQWFFDSVINDGRHVYLEYSIMDEEKLAIQFVFALLYDEMEKDEKIIEIANNGLLFSLYSKTT